MFKHQTSILQIFFWFIHCRTLQAQSLFLTQKYLIEKEFQKVFLVMGLLFCVFFSYQTRCYLQFFSFSKSLCTLYCVCMLKHNMSVCLSSSIAMFWSPKIRRKCEIRRNINTNFLKKKIVMKLYGFLFF